MHTRHDIDGEGGSATLAAGSGRASAPTTDLFRACLGRGRGLGRAHKRQILEGRFCLLPIDIDALGAAGVGEDELLAWEEGVGEPHEVPDLLHWVGEGRSLEEATAWLRADLHERPALLRDALAWLAATDHEDSLTRAEEWSPHLTGDEALELRWRYEALEGVGAYCIGFHEALGLAGQWRDDEGGASNMPTEDDRLTDLEAVLAWMRLDVLTYADSCAWLELVDGLDEARPWLLRGHTPETAAPWVREGLGVEDIDRLAAGETVVIEDDGKDPGGRHRTLTFRCDADCGAGREGMRGLEGTGPHRTDGPMAVIEYGDGARVERHVEHGSVRLVVIDEFDEDGHPVHVEKHYDADGRLHRDGLEPACVMEHRWGREERHYRHGQEAWLDDSGAGLHAWRGSERIALGDEGAPVTNEDEEVGGHERA